MNAARIGDLLAFIAVARERSFTKAAGTLGVSQSALSHTIRRLETRLGLRLLTRTARSVAPTQAGERLLDTAGPRLVDIEAELTSLTEMRDRPAGSIRITTSAHPARTILLPKLAPLLRQYPEIKVEYSATVPAATGQGRPRDVSASYTAIPPSPPMRRKPSGNAL
jgi:DNA-binding transcriptional LysR family regulator